jgi:2-polyprenyl-6-methoxyphenol hydroxylase-like FAD-dependent oxidoreductase
VERDVSEKSTKHRAIVIGGSIAGLFVGAFLRRIGWQVDIYERSSIELIGRGVGIFATHLELLEALDKCGAGTVGPEFPRNAHDAIGTNGTEFTVGIGGTADMDRCVASTDCAAFDR